MSNISLTGKNIPLPKKPSDPARHRPQENVVGGAVSGRVYGVVGGRCLTERAHLEDGRRGLSVGRGYAHRALPAGRAELEARNHIVGFALDGGGLKRAAVDRERERPLRGADDDGRGSGGVHPVGEPRAGAAAVAVGYGERVRLLVGYGVVRFGLLLAAYHHVDGGGGKGGFGRLGLG